MEDKSILGNTSPNATDDILESVTVPDGEVWYVDSIYATSDGAGTDTNFRLNLAAGQTGALDAERFLVSAPRGTQASIQVDSQDNDSRTMGAYVSGGEEIRLKEDDDDTIGGTVYYSVQIRRIL